jgi:cytochrome c-type biogenesis protein CcmH
MKFLLILVSLVCGGVAMAQTQEAYVFATKVQQQQFAALTQELRCLVCQNETIADSNAPLAKDLRQQVYQQIIAGKDPTAIKPYLVERYGQFILFKPKFNASTLILWTFPFLFICLGFIFLVRYLMRFSKP